MRSDHDDDRAASGEHPAGTRACRRVGRDGAGRVTRPRGARAPAAPGRAEAGAFGPRTSEAPERRGSAGRAAELARVSLYEMLDRIHEEGIPYEMIPMSSTAPPGGSSCRAQRWRVRRRPSTGPRLPTLEGGIDDLPSAIPTRPGPLALRRRVVARWRDPLLPRQARTCSGPPGKRSPWRSGRRCRLARRSSMTSGTGSLARRSRRRPVNRRMSPSVRRRLRLASTGSSGSSRSTRPERILAVKARSSRTSAGRRPVPFSRACRGSPFPVRQWRSVYIRELVQALGGA